MIILIDDRYAVLHLNRIQDGLRIDADPALEMSAVSFWSGEKSTMWSN
jgi:hypothetical protein